MRKFLAVPLIVALFACGAPDQSPPQPAATAPTTQTVSDPVPPESWSVTITTGGGFIGHGQGGVTVRSAGDARASRMMTGWCNPIELGPDAPAIERAVASAEPNLWTSCYNLANVHASCCDHFSYVVEFRRDEGERGEVVYKTSWQGATAPMPADLKTLFASVWQLRARALENCKG